jgi:hypothetical protein
MYPLSPSLSKYSIISLEQERKHFRSSSCDEFFWCNSPDLRKGMECQRRLLSKTREEILGK